MIPPEPDALLTPHPHGALIAGRRTGPAVEVIAAVPPGDATTVSLDVWRRVTGQQATAERLATGVAPDAVWMDYTPGSGPAWDYQYQVVAYSAEGETTPSTWAGVRVARYNVTRLGAAVFG